MRSGGHWVGREPLAEQPASGPFLRCKDEQWRLRCGIDSWFLPQEDAYALEQAVGDGHAMARVRIDARGNAALVDVEVRGRTKIAVRGQISEYIPNPTFARVAQPGSWGNSAANRGEGGKSMKDGVKPRAISDEEIVERCIYALVNEGARILEEGFALRASDIDMVYLTGYGFPPYRGGPRFYADTVGLAKVLAAIERFRKGYQGAQWQAAPLLVRLAKEGKRFNG